MPLFGILPANNTDDIPPRQIVIFGVFSAPTLRAGALKLLNVAWGPQPSPFPKRPKFLKCRPLRGQKSLKCKAATRPKSLKCN